MLLLGVIEGQALMGTNTFDQQKVFLKQIGKYSARFAIALLVIIYFSTSFKQVKIQESGILLRFGKIVQERVDSGICFKLPWPIDKLITVKTRSIETLRAGFGEDPNRIKEFERSYGPLDQLSNGTLTVPYIITGDKNVLHLKVLVNYMIVKPTIYKFEVIDGSKMLGMMTQNVILNYVSSARVDALLTSGKLELRDFINQRLNEILHEVDLGVRVVSVEVRTVRPPGSTTPAFKDVINAQEESREMVHQAESYAKRMIPEAHAEAQQMLSDAEAYRKKTVEGASGEARRFELLAAEYSLYPEVTRERLRQESIEAIFPYLSKYIIGKSDQGNAAHLRFFNKN
ncbi:FtsH protease activity modulator HflK [bacterium]|nr:FtsH protease activity modulator HflK [bacterium]